MITKFNEYIKESLMDIMISNADDDIRKKLSQMGYTSWKISAFIHKLDKSYLPSEEDIKKFDIISLIEYQESEDITLDNNLIIIKMMELLGFPDDIDNEELLKLYNILKELIIIRHNYKDYDDITDFLRNNYEYKSLFMDYMKLAHDKSDIIYDILMVTSRRSQENSIKILEDIIQRKLDDDYIEALESLSDEEAIKVFDKLLDINYKL